MERGQRVRPAIVTGCSLLLAVVAWFLRGTQGNERVLPSPTAAVADSEPIAADGPQTPHERAAVPVAERPSAIVHGLELRAHVTGRVIDEHQKPIASARVLLVALGNPGAGPSSSTLPASMVGAPLETRTDPDGRFEYGQICAVGYTYQLRVEATGLPLLVRYEPRIQPPSFDFGDIVLRDGASVSGRVVDPDGHGVAGARISWIRRLRGTAREQAGDDCGVSNADGTFLVRGLARERISLAADKDGLRSEWTPSLSLGGETHVEGVVIRVESGILVRGHVSDAETGEPIRAQVELNSMQSNRGLCVASDANGEFAGWVCGSSRMLEYGAQAPGYGPMGGSNVCEVRPSNGSAARLEIRLPRMGSLAFTVRDAATGGALADADVAWTSSIHVNSDGVINPRLFDGMSSAARADEAGRIHLDTLGRSSAFVAVRAHGHSPRVCSLKDLSAPGAEVRLDAGGLVEVQVLQSGVAASGVRVELSAYIGMDYQESRGIPEGSRILVDAKETDGSGVAHFSCVPPDQYTVRACDDLRSSAPRESVKVVVGQTTSITLEATAACGIHGKVSRDRVGSPDVFVLAQCENFTAPPACTDPDGRYALKGLGPGKYRVSTVRFDAETGERPEYDTSSREILLQPGENLELDLEEQSRVRLTGTVRVDGEPAPGLEVSFHTASASRNYRHPHDDFRGFTGIKGEFALDVPANSKGELLVKDAATQPRGLDLVYRAVSSSTQERAPIEIEVTTGSAEIELVRKDTGEPAWSTQAVLKPEAEGGGVPGFPSDFTWSLSGASPTFVLRALPPGHFVVQSRWPGGEYRRVAAMIVEPHHVASLRIEIEAQK